MVSVVLRARVAGRPIYDIELGVIAAGEPRWRTAVIDVLAFPGLRAWLAAFRHGPEPPHLLAGVLIEGGDESPSAMFAPRNAGNNEGACRKRRGRGEVVLAPVRALCVPEKITGKAVGGDHMGVIGFQKNALACHSAAAVESGIANYYRRGDQLLLPERAAGSAIQREAL